MAPSYNLSIEIAGHGKDPNARSHWSFFIHERTTLTGDLLHVLLISLPNLWYVFDHRAGIDLALAASRQASSLGFCTVASLTAEQRRTAIEVISAEPPPMDGKRGCQDWVLDVLVSLEVEGLVGEGTAGVWGALVGKDVEAVRGVVGET